MAIDPTGISNTDPGPQSAAADGQQAAAHSLPDQIARDRYLNAKAARSNRRRGVMFSKITPAGCAADRQATGIGGIGFDKGGF